MAAKLHGDTLQWLDEVKLWWVDLGVGVGGLDLLSADECARAARFTRPELGRRYVNAHGALRLILGAELGLEPARLKFRLGLYGKPSVFDDQIPFNLSHSDDLGLIGVGGRKAIGVDCERCIQHKNLKAIAAGFCSTRELAVLSTLPGNRLLHAFYAIWTRKEAVLKAAGCGLSVDLAAVEVGVGAVDIFDRVVVPGHAAWWVCSLQAPLGYSGAYAVEAGGPPTSPAQRQFEWDNSCRSLVRVPTA